MLKALLAAATLLTPAAAAAADLNVLYAGSLLSLMEHGIGPAFDQAGGDSFRGFAAGSNALANQIKGKQRQADVFISAAPGVNAGLMGAQNGDWVSWYITFAQSPLVIGYNANSRFAAELKSKPWYEVLREPGIHIGRTDPKLDPKGALTVQLLEHAQDVYHQPGLAAAVLGEDENPAEIMPEENLVGRLQSGQLDVGFFYSTETADLHIDAIPLPPEVALSAHYTVTILKDAPDQAAAVRFVNALLSPAGRAIMQQQGLDVVAPVVSGDAKQMPADLHLH